MRGDIEVATQILFQALRMRGYTCTFLRSVKAEVEKSFGTRPEVNSGVKEKNKYLVPLVTTFSSASVKLNSTLKKKKKKIKDLQDAMEPFSDFRIISGGIKTLGIFSFMPHYRVRSGK